MKLNHELSLNKDTIDLVNKFESYLGILNNQLLIKLKNESRNPVYKLPHHENQLLLSIQCFRLYKSCKSLTSENIIRLINDYRYKYDSLLNNYKINPLLYPVLPDYHVDNILNTYNKVKPYYSDQDNLLKDEFLRADLEIDFYSDWERLLSLSEEKAEEFWIRQMLSLVNLESNEDNQRTILNVIRRAYKNIDYYLTARDL